MTSKFVVAALFLAACGAMQQHETDNLADAIRGYNEGVHWERWEVAADAVPKKELSAFIDEHDENSKDLKITEYDIVKVDKKGPKSARVQVKMSWYKTSEGTVHQTSSIQTWELQGKDWMMVDESRLRGAEMPGLQEPIDVDHVAKPAKPAATSMKD